MKKFTGLAVCLMIAGLLLLFDVIGKRNDPEWQQAMRIAAFHHSFSGDRVLRLTSGSVVVGKYSLWKLREEDMKQIRQLVAEHPDLRAEEVIYDNDGVSIDTLYSMK